MKQQIKKQPYQKPLLKKIELKTDEVLAAGCKIDGGVSGEVSLTNPTGICNPCLATGS